MHEEVDNKLERQRHGIKELLKMSALLVVWLFFVYAAVVIVIELVFNKGDLNNDEAFETLDDPYKDIVEWAVPNVRQHYRGMSDDDRTYLLGDRGASARSQQVTTPSLLGDIGVFAQSHPVTKSCIESFFDTLQDNVTHTSPSYVALILQGYGLSESSATVHKHLKNLIDAEQEIAPLYNKSTECLRSNVAMEKMACEVNEQIRSVDGDFLEFQVNIAVVLDAITDAMVEDLSVAAEISQIIIERQVEIRNIVSVATSDDVLEFVQHKYDGIADSLKQSINGLATNSQNSGAAFSWRAFLQTNILEAVKMDIVNGNDDNARVGIALAANVGFEPVYQNHRLEWPLGKDWVDAYISWNTAFVFSMMHTMPSKLIIPSVACAAVRDEGRDFIHRRIFSLAASFLNLLLMDNLDRFDSEHLAGDIDPMKIANIKKAQHSFASASGVRDALVASAGKASLENAVLSNPSQDRVEKMFHTLCGNFCEGLDQWRVSRSYLSDHIDDEDYSVYMAVVVWGTVLMTGLGFELTVWVMFLQSGWEPKFEAGWKFAQFLFPLFAMVRVIT